MTDIAQTLDRIVPPYDGTGDWHRVLRDAGLDRRPRRLPLRLAAAVALVAVAAGVVALWPSGTGPSVVDRALAATAGGPVLHFVYESDLEHVLVDLETGERTEVTAEQEVWFDPEAGLRETQRFEGVVQFDVSLGPAEVSEHASTLYTSLGAGYREALESGRAEVLGEDVVEGTPVYWIRVGPDNHDVAVSKETYEPVFIRVDQYGRTGLTRIVAYQTMPAGSAPLEVTEPVGLPSELGSYGADVELADAGALLGRAPVWVGPDLHGFALDAVRELRLPTPDGTVTGLSVAYGSAGGAPHVEISQAAEPVDSLTMIAGVRGYEPPEGTLLLSGTMALLRSNGLVVTIHAPDGEMAIEVARSLRPYVATR
jgi:hypothetical protein